MLHSKNLNMKNLIYLLLITLAFGACTDLNEELREDLAQGIDPDPNNVLTSAYNAMRLPYQDQSRFWGGSRTYWRPGNRTYKRTRLG